MNEPFTTKDARGKLFRFARLPERIVSLVPSDTYTLARLGAGERLVGRTSFCVEPAEMAARVPELGGTKNPDVARIIELAPDLVIANQEENSRPDIEKIEDAGIRTYVSFPKRVQDGVGLVAIFARMLGETPESKELVRFAYRAHRDAEARRAEREPVRAFVPIWIDPLMSVHGDTFISDTLDLLGYSNVFATRARRYPLSADIGSAPPLPAHRTVGRDVRYPRVTVDEVVAHAPELIVLPDEPHAFTEADAKVFAALDTPASKSGRIVFVEGRDLMWPGLRSLEGLERLRKRLAAG